MVPTIIRELGDGLILRRSSAADADKLVEFNGNLHREPGAEGPEEHVAAWVGELMSGAHPTFDVSDFTIVEDAGSGAIVSCLCLISQTWSYGGVQFGVGRPELVGTHPDYRNRGLIRAQFDVVHGWSAERGERLQAITGIPWFYRQFGYEMAITLGGRRVGYKRQIPKLKDGEEEPYRIRPANEADLPFIAQLYEQGTSRYPVACVWDEALWRYELASRSDKSYDRRALAVIETPPGEPVGFLAHAPRLVEGHVSAASYELKPGVSWWAVTPSVVRYLWALGEEWAAQDPKREMEYFGFWLGAEHPVYQVFDKQLPHSVEPYAWYVRVPDLPGFLRHVAPILERRLASSPMVGHSGEIKISFYRSGLRLVFEGGRLIEVGPWQPTPEQEGDAGFADLTFMQLLFGYRSMAELDYAFADCWASGSKARPLFDVLFPKCHSNIWPVS
jgi:GNAT superfamily N-acetyltransferase